MEILSGVKKKPLVLLLYGVHGIGKSTFGAQIPNHICISGEDVEDSGATRLPQCKSWYDFLKQLDYLIQTNHSYTSLVIDTIDSIEMLLQKHIVKEANAISMARACGGYGKAYEKAVEEMVAIRDEKLDYLVEKKGMEIILLAHSIKNKFEDPLTNTTYDTYDLKLHKKMIPVFSEWVRAIVFANFVVFKAENNQGKEYAIGEGQRRIFTEPRPSHNAKNRFNLPFEMNLSYQELKHHIKLFYEKTGATGQSMTLNEANAETMANLEPENTPDEPKNTEPEQNTVSRFDVVRGNIKELLMQLNDKTILDTVVKSVQTVGDNMEQLSRIQSKLIKMTK